MEPEVTTPNRKRRILIIIVGITIAALGACGYLSYYKKGIVEKPEVLVKTETPKELTEAEKLLKSQIDELDRARAQVQSQSTTTLQSQIKSLDIIKKKTVSNTAPKTIEQQIQELDAVRTTLNK